MVKRDYCDRITDCISSSTASVQHVLLPPAAGNSNPQRADEPQCSEISVSVVTSHTKADRYYTLGALLCVKESVRVRLSELHFTYDDISWVTWRPVQEAPLKAQWCNKAIFAVCVCVHQESTMWTRSIVDTHTHFLVTTAPEIGL